MIRRALERARWNWRIEREEFPNDRSRRTTVDVSLLGRGLTVAWSRPWEPPETPRCIAIGWPGEFVGVIRGRKAVYSDEHHARAARLSGASRNEAIVDVLWMQRFDASVEKYGLVEALAVARWSEIWDR